MVKTKPVPQEARLPWYLSTAPCYASIYLWMGFFDPLAVSVMDRATYPTVLAGLLTGAILSYLLFYHVPARLGMTTGHPFGVLGSSTFGSKGALFVPSLLVGVCLTVWLGIALWFSSALLFRGIGISAGPGNVGYGATTAVLGLAAAYLALSGFRVVRMVVLPLSILSVLALPVLFLPTADGLILLRTQEQEPLTIFLLLVHLVTAFSATACAASAEFGRRARDDKDLFRGGVGGVVIPILVSGSLGLLTVAGARALDPDISEWGYLGAARFVSSNLGAFTNFWLAMTCLPAACIFALLAVRSLLVPFPRVPRKYLVVGVAAGAVVCTLSGLPGNWKLTISTVGALFAPVCGAMTADFILAKRKWPQSRPGINFAGFGAVVLGFGAGIAPDHIESWAVYGHPAAVYSFLTGFLSYVVLSNLGLKPYRKRVRKRKPEFS